MTRSPSTSKWGSWRLAAGSDQDALCGEDFACVGTVGNLHHSGNADSANALEMIDLVFLKEEADALSHRIGHIARTANDLGEIVLETAHGDTEVFAVLHF